MKEVLRNQILDAFVEGFYMELHERVYGYDRVTPKQLLDHIFEKYAKIDDSLLIKNRQTFEEAPDMSRPIAHFHIFKSTILHVYSYFHNCTFTFNFYIVICVFTFDIYMYIFPFVHLCMYI